MKVPSSSGLKLLLGRSILLSVGWANAYAVGCGLNEVVTPSQTVTVSLLASLDASPAEPLS